MDIDRYQITMDGETLFNEEFYKNLFINIYNHTGIQSYWKRNGKICRDKAILYS